MPLPASFLDELRARTPLASLIGARTRLVRNGRQWKACCPFHGEKTPSFYVYDDHYHCFGCGAHGDAIRFVMETDGLGFREAVERLAAEAGLEVPKESPRAAEREARARDLHAVLEAAAEAMTRRLRAPEGRAGLDYLRRRGLTDETIARFGLGWSGPGRGALAADLKPLGIEAEQLVEGGLVKRNEEGGGTTDLFFDRVTFPIRDRRGRVVSFGGRTLGDRPPKYLNGPETAVFSKRRTLYGLDLAREAVFRQGATLVAVEGYMDVIALHQAGFGGAVAPLGTALTEEQLGEMWRHSPEPVLCFDGDAAGARAAARAAEAALPLLGEGRTLRIATLPSGQDPDDLVLRTGRGAFQAVLDAARPLSEALFGMLAAEGGGAGASDTPERRAAFRNRISAAASRIPDRALAAEYRASLLNRYFAATRSARRGAGGRPNGAGADGAFRPRAPRLPIEAAGTRLEQARCLLAVVLAHPVLLDEVEEALGLLDLPPGPPARLRDALLGWLGGGGDGPRSLDSAPLADHLRLAGLGEDLAWATRREGLPPEARPDAQPAEALEGWWHFFARLRGEESLVEERAEALRAWCETNDPAAYARSVRLTDALLAFRRGEQPGGGAPPTGEAAAITLAADEGDGAAAGAAAGAHP